FRYSLFGEKIKELLKGKKPVCLMARYNCTYANIPSPFWWNSEHCGGPIVEQATHFADISRYLVGEVDMDTVYSRSVKASLTPGDIGYLEKLEQEVSWRCSSHVETDKFRLIECSINFAMLKIQNRTR
ncbi:hypothetical protein PR003_g27333, partial [Phytophthora rubi]